MLERHLRFLSAVYKWGVGFLAYEFSLIDTRGTKEEAQSNAWPVGFPNNENRCDNRACCAVAVSFSQE
jgi:hypothetical protein